MRNILRATVAYAATEISREVRTFNAFLLGSCELPSYFEKHQSYLRIQTPFFRRAVEVSFNAAWCAPEKSAVHYTVADTCTYCSNIFIFLVDQMCGFCSHVYYPNLMELGASTSPHC